MDPNTPYRPDLNPSAPPPATRGKTSPWVYVGCGCALVVVLCALVFFFIGRKIVETGKNMEQGLKDPAVRERRTKELLGPGELPAGYYPAGVISVPFVLDMVLLGDHPVPAGSEGMDFTDHSFMFMKIKLGKLPDSEEGRQKLMNGTNGKNAWEQGGNFHVDMTEELGQGNLAAGNANIRYKASRGDMRINNQRHQGITSTMLVECPDRRIRFAFWFGPDPSPGQTTASFDKTNTPADPQALTTFLNHFNLCTDN
jgi:hypothetical protein